MAATKVIELKTAIPGPRSKEILERKERVVASPLSVFLPVVIDRGEGATLTDVDGNTFIDFTGGVGCLNVGHANPRVIEAVQKQAAKFLHTDFTIVPYETYVTLAERLIESTPISGPAKVAFFNAGTEAVENAVKFARAYTKRPAVIAFEGGFHGRTLLSLSLTSKTHPYKAGLGPFAPEIYRMPFAQDYRGPNAEDALATLERALVTHVAAENVAAIVVEPVLGEGGYAVPPPDFLPRLRALADRHGILLVFDEVQTGMGRTGKMFAAEHTGVVPDILLVAKGIASGMPLGAMMARREVMTWPPGSHGSTIAGNPVAIAAGLATIGLLESSLVANSARVGTELKAMLADKLARMPAVTDVRGVGLMIGVELASHELADAVAQLCFRRGLLVLECGKKAIRLSPPLIISEPQARTVADVFAAVIADARVQPA